MIYASAFGSINAMTSNLVIISNLWIDPEHPETTTAWSCQAQVPGDLMVHFVGSRDVREINSVLTAKQIREYKERRFFRFHGETGTAFAPS